MPQDQRGRLEKSQVETNEKMAHWTRIVGVFTAVLAVVSFLTLLAVGWQSYTAWTTASDAREQQRAVIQFASVQSFAGPATDTGEQVYGFSAILQNFGSTRANNASGWQSVNYYEGSIPNNVDFSLPREAVEQPHAIVGSNASVTFTPVAIKAKFVEQALNKAGVIALWGSFSYFDIYDPVTPHTIQFCDRLTPTKTEQGIVLFAVTPLRTDCNKP